MSVMKMIVVTIGIIFLLWLVDWLKNLINGRDESFEELVQEYFFVNGNYDRELRRDVSPMSYAGLLFITVPYFFIFQKLEQQLQTDIQQFRDQITASREIPNFHPRPGQRSNDEILTQTHPQSSHSENDNLISIQIHPSAPIEIGWAHELEESNDLPSYGEAISQLSRSHNNLSASVQSSSHFTSSRSTSHLFMPSAPPASNMSQDNDGLPSYGEAMAFLVSK